MKCGFILMMKFAEYSRCYLEIYKHGTGINDSTDKRCRHNCRVKSYFFCEKRKQTADKLCYYGNSDYGKCYYKCKAKVLIDEEDSESVCNGEYQPDNKGYSEFLECRLENIFKLYLSCRKPSYYCSGTL